jgi:hypothetical protein
VGVGCTHACAPVPDVLPPIVLLIFDVEGILISDQNIFFCYFCSSELLVHLKAWIKFQLTECLKENFMVSLFLVSSVLKYMLGMILVL